MDYHFFGGILTSRSSSSSRSSTDAARHRKSLNLFHSHPNLSPKIHSGGRLLADLDCLWCGSTGRFSDVCTLFLSGKVQSWKLQKGMKSGKGHLEENDDNEEFGARKDVMASTNSNKDGKNIDKASAMRSKHSVTEQRRRSKINERFQILQKLIPNSDQKRDTASFLLEVTQYVQFLQEKVQKYGNTTNLGVLNKQS